MHTLRHHEPHTNVGRYLRDAVFGANDGLVTTFAIVAGAIGADFPHSVVIVLGIANLVADGISMGLGDYLAGRSDIAYYRGEHERETWEIEHYPDEERREVEEIFAKWGFQGNDRTRAVSIITKNRKAWLDIMMKHELNLQDTDHDRPEKHGLVMFFAFVIAGIVPILAFLFSLPSPFLIAIVLTALTLFTVGALRSRFSALHWWRGGLEMLFIGGTAAIASYFLGILISHIAS